MTPRTKPNTAALLGGTLAFAALLLAVALSIGERADPTPRADVAPKAQAHAALAPAHSEAQLAQAVTESLAPSSHTREAVHVRGARAARKSVVGHAVVGFDHSYAGFYAEMGRRYTSASVGALIDMVLQCEHASCHHFPTLYVREEPGRLISFLKVLEQRLDAGVAFPVDTRAGLPIALMEFARDQTDASPLQLKRAVTIAARLLDERHLEGFKELLCQDNLASWHAVHAIELVTDRESLHGLLDFTVASLDDQPTKAWRSQIECTRQTPPSDYRDAELERLLAAPPQTPNAEAILPNLVAQTLRFGGASGTLRVERLALDRHLSEKTRTTIWFQLFQVQGRDFPDDVRRAFETCDSDTHRDTLLREAKLALDERQPLSAPEKARHIKLIDELRATLPPASRDLIGL